LRLSDLDKFLDHEWPTVNLHESMLIPSVPDLIPKVRVSIMD